MQLGKNFYSWNKPNYQISYSNCISKVFRENKCPIFYVTFVLTIGLNS